MDPLGPQVFCPPGTVAGEQSARELLQPYAVSHADFARRTIYSWTTAEQVLELQQDATLLTRSMTTDGERGRAADIMMQLSASDSVAKVLSRPEYANRRFGWSNPWATLLGWETEQYGDRLIRIDLRPEAWVARAIVEVSGQVAWAFADVAGNPVTQAQVLAEPQRLAAVYFEDRRGEGENCGTLQLAGTAFREYFVHNEAMIESWSIDTQDIRDELDAAVLAIETLLTAVNDRDCMESLGCWPDTALDVWASDTAPAALFSLYSSALAFPNDAYTPRAENLQSLLEALANVPFEEPMTHDYGP
jgi:hypothetical protein